MSLRVRQSYYGVTLFEQSFFLFFLWQKISNVLQVVEVYHLGKTKKHNLFFRLNSRNYMCRRIMASASEDELDVPLLGTISVFPT